HEVLLEGGATLGSAFLGAGLVQRLVLYSAPLVLGGGLAWSDGIDRALASAARGRIVSHDLIGDDLCLVVDLER
ncbi:MAG TPA: dihydrofolate reductase family protein, partial [Candidatus Eisenbacteria bacterium]